MEVTKVKRRPQLATARPPLSWRQVRANYPLPHRLLFDTGACADLGNLDPRVDTEQDTDFEVMTSARLCCANRVMAETHLSPDRGSVA